MIKKIKREIRGFGIDEAPFDKFKPGLPVLVVGVVYRKPCITGVLSTKVSCDGADAAKRLVRMINESRHKKQLRVVMLDGIALAGFNVVDIHELSEKTGLAVIVVVRRKPDLNGIHKALSRFEDAEKRWNIIESAGEVKKQGKIYFQHAGIPEHQAREVIKLTTTSGDLPEPVRLAHIIASGVESGDSRGRA